MSTICIAAVGVNPDRTVLDMRSTSTPRLHAASAICSAPMSSAIGWAIRATGGCSKPRRPPSSAGLGEKQTATTTPQQAPSREKSSEIHAVGEKGVDPASPEA